MKLELVTPEKIVFSDEIDQVSLPTSDGEITVLPHHIPLITQVKPGELTIKKNNKVSHFVTGSGFVEVTGQTISILTDLAETSDNLDEKKIEEVVFVEVKSGQSQLSKIEKTLKEAIQNKKVDWHEYKVPEEMTK